MVLMRKKDEGSWFSWGSTELIMSCTKVSLALNSVFFIQNRSIRYCLYKRSHVGMKTLKKLTTSLFVKDLISTFFLTVLRFLRKLFLRSKTNKYEIFCFETKISIKKHVFWSKKFVVSDNNSFEQCADGPEVDEFT